MNSISYCCPACEKTIYSEPEVIECWKEFKILRCPFCDVFFANPITPAGNFIGEPYIELDWNHRQFLEKPPL